jgi:hypothetical protein
LAFVEPFNSYQWEVGILLGLHQEHVSYLFGTPTRIVLS